MLGLSLQRCGKEEHVNVPFQLLKRMAETMNGRWSPLHHHSMGAAQITSRNARGKTRPWDSPRWCVKERQHDEVPLLLRESMSWWAQKSHVVVSRGQCSIKWRGPYGGGPEGDATVSETVPWRWQWTRTIGDRVHHSSSQPAPPFAHAMKFY